MNSDAKTLKLYSPSNNRNLFVPILKVFFLLYRVRNGALLSKYIHYKA